ncbi:MAG: hypothetical protein PVI26_04515 [Chitinispirillia bacterium]
MRPEAGKKRFFYSLLPGLTEPAGSVFAFWLSTFFPITGLTSILLAMVAGVMVFISIDQLLPSAQEYGRHHLATYGFATGMVGIGFVLLL